MDNVEVFNDNIRIEGSYTMTVYPSGLDFDLINPKMDQILITDIAHHLGNVCRYNGACDPFYSVAQHSVIVSKMVPEEFAFDGLMHDAAEAYLGDIISPFKRLLKKSEFFTAIKNRVERAVAIKFECSYPEPAIVKKADTMIRAIEARQLANIDPKKWGLEEVAGSAINPLGCKESRELFLARFYELTTMEPEEFCNGRP